MAEKVKLFFKNSCNKRKLQGTVGILVILCFVVTTILVTENTQAIKSSGYGYGYSSGAYGYGYGYSSQAPSAISSLACYATSTTAIACQFGAVTTATDSTSLDNFSSYKLYYSTASSTANRTNGSTGGTDTNRGSAGQTITVSTSSLTAATTYYFVAYTMDDNSNYSAISNVVTIATRGSVPESSPGGGPGGGPGDTTPPPVTPPVITPPPTTTVVTPTGPLTLTQLTAEAAKAVPVLPAKRDIAAEQSAIAEVITLLKTAPKSAAEWQVVQYIAYGSTNSSKTYSSRERRDVMYDYKQIFGAAPVSAVDWNDANLMINGHKPAKVSTEREKVGKAEFKKVYKREANLTNEHDKWAVDYAAYAIRYRPRSLAKEKVAISTFKSVYKYTPSNATDWSVVRAVAYSGASR